MENNFLIKFQNFYQNHFLVTLYNHFLLVTTLFNFYLQCSQIPSCETSATQRCTPFMNMAALGRITPWEQTSWLSIQFGCSVALFDHVYMN